MSGEDKSEGAGKPGEAGMKTGFIGILAVGLMIGIIIGVAVGAFGFPQTQSQDFSAGSALTPEKAGVRAIDFITNYAVAPGVDVELINVTEVEGANLYKMAVNISSMRGAQTAESYMTKDGKLLFPSGIDIEEFEETIEQQKREEENRTREQQEQKTTIGNFMVSGEDICTEDGTPIIYFFGSEGCGACKWEHPVIANVTAKFGGFISFHDNVDSTADQEIFDKYSTGYIPTLVLGCKYYRVGSGASMGEEQETKVLTALICDLTGNKPVDVCTAPEIADLI
ncbi:MAG: thioredoxin family protein, partial [Euryarchaeota archaeon]|nr:thioredoxin family protein [Euryarchaeota archaeon]